MKNIWIWNHYATNQFLEHGGRHYNFAKYLIKAEYNVTVFCASTVHNSDNTIDLSGQLFKEDILDNIKFVFVKAPPYKGNGVSRIKNMLAFTKNVKKAALTLSKKEKPDVIIASSVHPFTCRAGIKTAKKLGVPCIVEIRDLWPLSIVEYQGVSDKNPAIKILYQLEKWIYKKADRIIFTIKGGRDYIIDKGWDKDIDLNKIYYINNGVDLDVFDENVKNYIIDDNDLKDDNTFKVVYTGSLRYANRMGTFVDVAKYISDKKIDHIKFLLWGEGDDKEKIKNNINKFQLKNIILKDRVDKKNIPYILSCADLLVEHGYATDLMKYGLSANKLFEYIASGKPILSTLETKYDLIGKNQCGVTLDNPSVETIAKEIIKFSQLSKEEYSKFCENTKNLSKKYDFKKLTDDLIDIIKNL